LANRRAHLCRACDSYIELSQGVWQPIPDSRLAQDYIYAVPTPWTDLRAVTFPGVISALPVQLTDLALTKNKGIRVLDATWPSSCCICGKPATRFGQHARVVIIPREWGFINLGTQKVTLVANGVPYCNAHSDGVLFDRVPPANPLANFDFGLNFRLLGFRNAFRKLNPWPWRK
jgi:hypothetical protein